MKQFSIQLDDNTLNQLEKIAEEHDISLAKCIRIYVRKGIDADSTNQFKTANSPSDRKLKRMLKQSLILNREALVLSRCILGRTSEPIKGQTKELLQMAEADAKKYAEEFGE